MIMRDCWRTIGTGGDLSCPELVQHIHCRNCPVLSAAASGIRQRDLPAGYADAALASVALPVPRPPKLETALFFKLAQEWMALDSHCVEEIAASKPIHRVPHRAGLVAGLVNVRGQLLLAVHLGALLEASAGTNKKSSAMGQRIVVIRQAGERWAFVADEVRGVVSFDPAERLPIPATASPVLTGVTRGTVAWDDSRVTLLSSDALFDLLRQRILQ
ncbi:MAG: chemotaxis protein CheW [Sinobacteraceae bacterium]|nr:chemotaxis protein CheW [Nevskiaceae bacterium]